MLRRGRRRSRTGTRDRFGNPAWGAGGGHIPEYRLYESLVLLANVEAYCGYDFLVVPRETKYMNKMALKMALLPYLPFLAEVAIGLIAVKY